MRKLFIALTAIVACMFISLCIGKIYQHLDDDEYRGAIAIDNGLFGERYGVPIYLDRVGLNPIVCGSIIPLKALTYCLMIPLLPWSKKITKACFVIPPIAIITVICHKKPTFFNLDGLPVGFTKDEYKGKAM